MKKIALLICLMFSVVITHSQTKSKSLVDDSMNDSIEIVTIDYNKVNPYKTFAATEYANHFTEIFRDSINSVLQSDTYKNEINRIVRLFE